MVVDFWRKRNYYSRCWRLNFNKHWKEANQGNCLNADVFSPGLASSLWMNSNGPAERALKVWAVFKWLSKVIARVRLLRLLIGWKISRHFFNQWDAKSKRITHCTCDFSLALRKLHVIAKNSDWFMGLFAPVVIGRNNYFYHLFFISHLKTALLHDATQRAFMIRLRENFFASSYPAGCFLVPLSFVSIVFLYFFAVVVFGLSYLISSLFTFDSLRTPFINKGNAPFRWSRVLTCRNDTPSRSSNANKILLPWTMV